MKPTKLHPEVQKALRTPTDEERRLIKDCVSSIKEEGKFSSYATAFCLVLTFALAFIGFALEQFRFVLILAVFLALASLYGIHIVSQYKLLIPKIFANDYRLTKGTSYYIQQAGSNSFDVYGIIGNGKEANILFQVDMATIRAMPGDEWDFYIVASDRHTLIVIPGFSNDSYFISAHITSALAMPYCDPKE